MLGRLFLNNSQGALFRIGRIRHLFRRSFAIFTASPKNFEKHCFRTSWCVPCPL